MRDGLVAIKGVKDGLLVSLNESEDWQRVINDLAARIDEQSSFFAGAKISVDIGTRPVPKYALSSLKALLERRNLMLSVIISDSDTTLEAAQALDLRTAIATEKPGQPQPTDTINPEEDGSPGVLIRRTLRSGRIIRSAGHVIVLGDVNPGAEIIAHGDVIVWGVLRGSVHAGAEGDTGAIVCALEMTPMQLRIAGVAAQLPNPKRRTPAPEIARLEQAQVVIISWNR
ncbi:MAG: septum site-determining protein MinC [Anaerolineae bacterium]|jgi:septum site-determining protein MinC|nr:septum site-determining protein MinC [Anaerolineae bacterium]